MGLMQKLKGVYNQLIGSTMDALSQYLTYNSRASRPTGILKEWFWDEDMLHCIIDMNVDDDDIDDFVDALTLIVMNHDSIKVMLSRDIGEYLEVFHGMIEITIDPARGIKIKKTNAAYKEKETIYFDNE